MRLPQPDSDVPIAPAVFHSLVRGAPEAAGSRYELWRLTEAIMGYEAGAIVPRPEIESRGWRLLDTLEGESFDDQNGVEGISCLKPQVGASEASMATSTMRKSTRWLTLTPFEQERVNELKALVGPYVPSITTLPVVAVTILFVGQIVRTPGEYFSLLHWVVCAVSCVGIYVSRKCRGYGWWFNAMIGMAILFNPIVPFEFAVKDWQAFDLTAGVIFIFSIPVFKGLRPKP